MKKYLIAAAFILCAPQTILAQSEMFYVVLDSGLSFSLPWP